ncbi:hypothetical protein [Streptomyces lydicamycinicus]|uniref:hypothetical protein n=1 Tax=Streptomyces lydicamycinicus TaxID=1546107 RepID=UPI003C2BE50F
MKDLHLGRGRYGSGAVEQVERGCGGLLRQGMPDLAVVIERRALSRALVTQVTIRDDQAGAGEADVTHPTRPRLVERVEQITDRGVVIAAPNLGTAVQPVGQHVGDVRGGEVAYAGRDADIVVAEGCGEVGRFGMLGERDGAADVADGPLVQGMHDAPRFVALDVTPYGRLGAAWVFTPEVDGAQHSETELGQCPVRLHHGQQGPVDQLAFPRGA